MMGRVLMYSAIAALAVFVLSATFVLKHGGESIASVQHATIHDLTSTPQRYYSYPITTEGRLDFTNEHDVYQVVDEENLAVIIREYTGKTELDDLLGQTVRVSGTFSLDDELGVYFDADSVIAVGD